MPPLRPKLPCSTLPMQADFSVCDRRNARSPSFVRATRLRETRQPIMRPWIYARLKSARFVQGVSVKLRVAETMSLSDLKNLSRPQNRTPGLRRTIPVAVLGRRELRALARALRSSAPGPCPPAPRALACGRGRAPALAGARPASSNRGSAIGGKRPKLTFIGWNERGPASIDSIWPPVMWFRSAPIAVVGGGGSRSGPAVRRRRSARR